MRTVVHRIAALAGAAILALVLTGPALAVPAGTITSVAPASGPVAGGTSVTIVGTGFWYGTSGPKVTIGGTAATMTSSARGAVQNPPLAYDTVVVTTPAGTAGPAAVKVLAADPSYNDLLLAENSTGFTYVPPLALSGISPANGLTPGGEPVTITGAGFSGGSTPAVTIGGNAATDVTVVNDTTLTATTPARTTAGVVDVVVGHDGFNATLAGGFTYGLGYRVTVTNAWPKSAYFLSSWGGAVRALVKVNGVNTYLGDWTSTTGPRTVDTGRADTGRTDTLTSHLDYRGGLNCGTREAARGSEDKFGVSEWTTERWAGGPCAVSVPAGSALTLEGIQGSYAHEKESSIIAATYTTTVFPFVSAMDGDCVRAFATCRIGNISKDVPVSVTWGQFVVVADPFQGTRISAAYSTDGGLTFYDAAWTAVQLSPGGEWRIAITMPATKQERGRAAEQGATTRIVACSTAAVRSGKRLSARCRTTPALAAALKRGSVRARAEWKLRLPHQRSFKTISTGSIVLRNRAGTTRVTG